MAMWIAFSCIVVACCLQLQMCSAYKSNMSYKPVGESPLLYRPGVDKVLNLDQETFEDTVFDSSKPILVEVYKDWCGHCRKFLPIFREFSYAVQNWNDSVQIAVINCADLHNRKVCNGTRAHGKTTVPSMKYFHAHSTNYSESYEFDPEHTVEAMRAHLVEKLTEEMPEKDSALVVKAVEIGENHCDSLTTVEKELWKQASSNSVEHIALVVIEEGDDNHTNLATQLKLDLSPYKEKLEVLMLKSTSNAAELLDVKEVPTVVLLKKGTEKPLFSGQIHLNTSTEIVKHAELKPVGSQLPNLMMEKTKPKIDCDKDPEHCKELYYVSERDMLKALKVALYNEILNEDSTEGDNFDNLKNFLQLLIDNFPTSTKRNAPRESSTTTLKSSEKAHAFFKDMLEFMESKKDRKFTSDEWNSTFIANEEKENPFPKKSDEFEHCKGSSIEYRGFTCGLWSAFHTLTINSYLNAKEQQPSDKNSKGQTGELRTLPKTFHEHDNNEFPMDKSKVQKPEDAFMYMWEAHNLVNNHLHGDMTEDPQFIKYQFPPAFLCTSCKADNKKFDKENVQKFLLEYYTNIKPHN
uniref:Sulfhydryl oxidase n=1 Tax=Ditylenchus dipsaci TaxID=166011 RepID=A0A915DQQ7_9BILA